MVVIRKKRMQKNAPLLAGILAHARLKVKINQHSPCMVFPLEWVEVISSFS